MDKAEFLNKFSENLNFDTKEDKLAFLEEVWEMVEIMIRKNKALDLDLETDMWEYFIQEQDGFLPTVEESKSIAKYIRQLHVSLGDYQKGYDAGWDASEENKNRNKDMGTSF